MCHELDFFGQAIRLRHIVRNGSFVLLLLNPSQQRIFVRKLHLLRRRRRTHLIGLWQLNVGQTQRPLMQTFFSLRRHLAEWPLFVGLRASVTVKDHRLSRRDKVNLLVHTLHLRQVFNRLVKDRRDLRVDGKQLLFFIRPVSVFFVLASDLHGVADSEGFEERVNRFLTKGKLFAGK